MAEHRYSYLQQGNVVRGIAAEAKGKEINLTEAEAVAIGKAFANWLIYKVGKNPVLEQVCIGVDTRETSEKLAIGLMKGLHAFGASTSYAGVATAPAMYLSTVLPYWEFDGAILVTAGDDSDCMNGFRFYTSEGALTEDEVADVLYHASRAYLSHEEYEPDPVNLMAIYASMLRSRLGSLEGVKIAVDTSNAAGAFFAEKVLAPMKAELVEAKEADLKVTIGLDGEKCSVKNVKGEKLSADSIPQIAGADNAVADGMLEAVQIIIQSK